jgi:HEPN domain-containing protein
MTKRDIHVKQENTRRVIRFLNDGFNDYAAARVLLLNGLLQQGAILASTAVEKYFKAMLATHGNESRGHLKKAQWKAVHNKYPNLFVKLNISFLELCQKCYLLRYTEDVPHHFNVAIAAREFLAELDHTLLLMERTLVRANEAGQPVKTRFEQMMESKDERLLKENHVLVQQVKEAFVYGAPQMVYELRRIANGVIVEVGYSSRSVPEDLSFTRQALVPKSGDEKSYTFSHFPIRQG